MTDLLGILKIVLIEKIRKVKTKNFCLKRYMQSMVNEDFFFDIPILQNSTFSLLKDTEIHTN